jgi:hypothetical protein
LGQGRAAKRQRQKKQGRFHHVLRIPMDSLAFTPGPLSNARLFRQGLPHMPATVGLTPKPDDARFVRDV